MKRFLLFTGDNYYPSGGWGDFQKDFDTLEEATNYMGHNYNVDWFQVVDSTTGEIVKE